MDREPKNVQVIIPDTSANSIIFLIDKNGIICLVKPYEHETHVSQPIDPGVEEPSLFCTLCDTDSKLIELKRTLEAQNLELQGTVEKFVKFRKPFTTRRGNDIKRMMSLVN